MSQLPASLVVLQDGRDDEELAVRDRDLAAHPLCELRFRNAEARGELGLAAERLWMLEELPLRASVHTMKRYAVSARQVNPFSASAFAPCPAAFAKR